MAENTLFVLLGPTGVGKTDLSISIAKKLGCSIISSDSRQIFREMNIGVAKPSEEQLAEVRHHFISTISVEDHYSSGQYEIEAIPVIEEEIAKYGNALMVGGSMLYIDAICQGIDDIPTIDPELRADVRRIYDEKGIEEVRRMLQILDPKHYAEVDLKNVKRMLHAIEVSLQAGKPFSSLRTNPQKKRSFNIVKIGLNRPREELYQNINLRVDKMISAGLVEEARSLLPFRSLNSLNTVGYKELFGYFDGMYDLEEATRLIKRNTRHYAKKQLSWFAKDETTKWFIPEDFGEIEKIISSI